MKQQLVFVTEKEIKDVAKEKTVTLKERIGQYGVKSLLNSEAISFVTGISEDIVKQYPDLHSLESDTKYLSITNLQKQKLETVFSIAKRFNAEGLGDRIRISSPDDAAQAVMNELRFMKKEYFKIMLLDTKNFVTSIELISVGSLNSSIVHPREVYMPAVKSSASSIILVHNHPSGEPEPSHEDIVLTNRLDECGKMLGIRVLDHIIIGDGVFFSFKEEGLI
jgi:DNA repair protein RadC